MEIIFYISAIISLFSTIAVVTRKNAVHAMLFLVVSLLAVAVIFFVVGAPFVAALEVIVYAGAIMVLFVFAIMMLNMGKQAVATETSLMSFGTWFVPAILCLILLGEMIYVLYVEPSGTMEVVEIGPAAVSESLFTGYALAVELTGMLLMSGIVGAYHIGRENKKEYHRYLQQSNDITHD